MKAIAEERKSSTRAPSIQQIDGPIPITDHLVDIFSAAIASAFPEIVNAPLAIIAPGTNPKFGDYQCNSSIGIVKLLGNTGGVKKPPSPRDIALKILENLPTSPVIEKCDVAGPGFINIYLSRSYAETALISVLLNGVQPPKLEKKRVIVDFSSPNIGK